MRGPTIDCRVCVSYTYVHKKLQSTRLVPTIWMINMQDFVFRWFWNPDTSTFLTKQPVFMKTRYKSDSPYFFTELLSKFWIFFLVILILHQWMLGITTCFINISSYFASMYSTSFLLHIWPRTTDAQISLFSSKSQTFGLGQTILANKDHGKIQGHFLVFF